jgi:hypothetical protein
MAIKFSIPNYPSFTSEEPNRLPILFVPNIPFLRKFVDGDLGIAKKINEKYHKKSLSKKSLFGYFRVIIKFYPFLNSNNILTLSRTYTIYYIIINL